MALPFKRDRASATLQAGSSRLRKVVPFKNPNQKGAENECTNPIGQLYSCSAHPGYPVAKGPRGGIPKFNKEALGLNLEKSANGLWWREKWATSEWMIPAQPAGLSIPTSYFVCSLRVSEILCVRVTVFL